MIFLALAGCDSFSAYSAPRVVVSIPPIHGLIAGLMQDVDHPYLILKGRESPHSFSLKPSVLTSIQRADLVIWMGPLLEQGLVKPFSLLPEKIKKVNILELSKLNRLPVRSFNCSCHCQHHDKHHHDSPSIDPHVWLDPANGRIIVIHLAKILSDIDPDNRQKYEMNKERILKKIDKLHGNLHDILSPVRGKPYLVFHDAYQYFERKFDLKNVGAITISPEIPLGAKRLIDINKKIQKTGALCLFAEPQFSDTSVHRIADHNHVKVGYLDPIGFEIDKQGEDFYVELLHRLAINLRTSLAESS